MRSSIAFTNRRNGSKRVSTQLDASVNFPHWSLSLCGANVLFGHDCPERSERLRRLLHELFVVSAEEPRKYTAPLRIHFSPEHDTQFATETKLLSDASGLRVESLPGGFVLDCQTARLHIDVVGGVGRGDFQDSFFRLPKDQQRRFLLLALVMLFRRDQRFALHAGGIVTRDGQGCLIAGRSGSGKTTLGLSLIQQGWSYLSDDVVVLHQDENRANEIDAFGINRGLACTPETAKRFQHRLRCPDRFGEKWITQLNGATRVTAAVCRPHLLLFPIIGNRSTSQLILLSPLEAMNELIQFSAGIMTHRKEATRQLQVLNRLVAQSRAFRMIAGRDVLECPQQVAKLLRHATER
ncbi:hypothetical protein [Novipirellula sp.]|uniref:hypothetical protein n=1 Tax=Novipirellula sp. TaxID=2795430 RepID=UPI0035637586